ncbi:hypothetical protein ACXC9Q_34225 [Kribbella sp. CWNU-51]
MAAPRVPLSVAKGNNWNVEPVDGSYRLTLRLDAPAPMRASLPLLAVDGVALGVAKQSPDQRTLTLISTDPAVLRAGDVRLICSGDLSVRILDDNLKEPTETFTATLHHSNAPTPTPPSPPPSPTTTDPTLSTHRPFSAADSGWWVLKEAVGE